MLKKIDIKRISNKLSVDYLFVAVAVVLGIYLGWNFIEIIIFGILIWTILHPLPSRYFAILALIFLLATPIFTILSKKVIAEETGIYAYYFIILALIMGIYEIKMKDRLKKADN